MYISVTTIIMIIAIIVVLLQVQQLNTTFKSIFLSGRKQENNGMLLIMIIIILMWFAITNPFHNIVCCSAQHKKDTNTDINRTFSQLGLLEERIQSLTKASCVIYGIIINASLVFVSYTLNVKKRNDLKTNMIIDIL